MSNKNKNHSKKWLITRLKTSGSKRRHIIDGDYADERNTKRAKDWEHLPSHEGMRKSFKFYNNKVNYGLLVRFLRGKVNEDWNEVYSEIIERIPSDLYKYKECIEWFVSDKVEERTEGLWDKRDHKFVRSPEVDKTFMQSQYALKEFYVHPRTNKLLRVEDSPSRKKTKGLNTDELREFRESEKKSKQENQTEELSKLNG